METQNLQAKVLIVDDDPDMRYAMHVRLKANNYAVAFAVDGISAVAAALRQMPDVILLDLGLPAGDGFWVLERLQASDVLATIPVIVVSGRDKAAHYESSIRAGARRFLQKPVRNTDLLLAIAQTLQVKSNCAILMGFDAVSPIVYDISGPSAASSNPGAGRSDS